MWTHFASEDDFARHLAVRNAHHAQFDQPIVDQDAVTGAYVIRQFRIRGGEAVRVADLRGHINNDLVTLGQRHRLVVEEFADPDLRALQVGHNRDVLTAVGRDLAHTVEGPAMRRVFPVREVEARHVHPLVNQAADHLLAVRGRSEGADDLRRVGQTPRRNQSVHFLVRLDSHTISVSTPTRMSPPAAVGRWGAPFQTSSLRRLTCLKCCSKLDSLLSGAPIG